MTKEEREELLAWAAESKPDAKGATGYRWDFIFDVYVVLRERGHSATGAIEALIAKGVVRRKDAEAAYFSCYHRYQRRVNRVKRQQAVPA